VSSAVFIITNIAESDFRYTRTNNLPFLDGTCATLRVYAVMPDFAIDPELRVRARPEKVLRRTSEALQFLREITPSRSSRAWQDAAESFEKIRDEWNAIEAVVNLELLLEAEGLLIEEPLPSPSERLHAA
jgi:hypothetical protein